MSPVFRDWLLSWRLFKESLCGLSLATAVRSTRSGSPCSTEILLPYKLHFDTTIFNCFVIAVSCHQRDCLSASSLRFRRAAERRLNREVLVGVHGTRQACTLHNRLHLIRYDRGGTSDHYSFFYLVAHVLLCGARLRLITVCTEVNR